MRLLTSRLLDQRLFLLKCFLLVTLLTLPLYVELFMLQVHQDGQRILIFNTQPREC